LLAPLVLLRAVGGTFAGVLIPLGLASGAVENCSDRFLAQGVASGDVKELLGGLWALVPQLVDQGLIGGPQQEGPDHVGVGDVGQLIALLGEMTNVLAESFVRLLPKVLEVPRVPRAHVGALEVTHKDLL
jgi:hypothetical protein